LTVFFRFQICIDSYILNGIDNYSDSYIYSNIFDESIIFYESRNSSENQSSSINPSPDGSDLTITETESSNDLDVTPKYRHLWVQCENCYGLNYKKFLK
jgi:acetyl-CoA carboxylase carboxyl transferase subunit beta